jgi:hypothetical protein
MRLAGRLGHLDAALAAALLGDGELSRSRLVRAYGAAPSRPLEDLLDALDLHEAGQLSERALGLRFAEHRSILEALLVISEAIASEPEE